MFDHQFTVNIEQSIFQYFWTSTSCMSSAMPLYMHKLSQQQQQQQQQQDQMPKIVSFKEKLFQRFG
jgi:hypothetical protein